MFVNGPLSHSTRTRERPCGEFTRYCQGVPDFLATRKEGDAFEGDDSSRHHSLQLAAIHPYEGGRLRRSSGADSHRRRQRGQRAE